MTPAALTQGGATGQDRRVRAHLACHHLRGEAGNRQIEGAKVGRAHVIGLGSACGVHVLDKSAA